MPRRFGEALGVGGGDEIIPDRELKEIGDGLWVDGARIGVLESTQYVDQGLILERRSKGQTLVEGERVELYPQMAWECYAQHSHRMPSAGGRLHYVQLLLAEERLDEHVLVHAYHNSD